MTCELASTGSCTGAVYRRNDGRELCMAHWGHEAPIIERPEVEPRVADEDAERAARAEITRVIHERDGIQMGIDPLGHPCRCDSCRELDGTVPEQVNQ